MVEADGEYGGGTAGRVLLWEGGRVAEADGEYRGRHGNIAWVGRSRHESALNSLGRGMARGSGGPVGSVVSPA